jgi:hypothetical protein
MRARDVVSPTWVLRWHATGSTPGDIGCLNFENDLMTELEAQREEGARKSSAQLHAFAVVELLTDGSQASAETAIRTLAREHPERGGLQLLAEVVARSGARPAPNLSEDPRPLHLFPQRDGDPDSGDDLPEGIRLVRIDLTPLSPRTRAIVAWFLPETGHIPAADEGDQASLLSTVAAEASDLHKRCVTWFATRVRGEFAANRTLGAERVSLFCVQLRGVALEAALKGNDAAAALRERIGVDSPHAVWRGMAFRTDPEGEVKRSFRLGVYAHLPASPASLVYVLSADDVGEPAWAIEGLTAPADARVALARIASPMTRIAGYRAQERVAASAEMFLERLAHRIYSLPGSAGTERELRAIQDEFLAGAPTVGRLARDSFTLEPPMRPPGHDRYEFMAAWPHHPLSTNAGLDWIIRQALAETSAAVRSLSEELRADIGTPGELHSGRVALTVARTANKIALASVVLAVGLGLKDCGPLVSGAGPGTIPTPPPPVELKAESNAVKGSRALSNTTPAPGRLRGDTNVKGQPAPAASPAVGPRPASAAVGPLQSRPSNPKR